MNLEELYQHLDLILSWEKDDEKTLNIIKKIAKQIEKLEKQEK